MSQEIFTIDHYAFIPISTYDVPGLFYQISSEHDGLIKGFIACKSLSEGLRELQFQLREFNARLTSTSRRWETRSYSQHAPTDHRGNQAKRRRKHHAALAS